MKKMTLIMDQLMQLKMSTSNGMWPLICYVAGYASYAAIKKVHILQSLLSDNEDEVDYFGLTVPMIMEG